MEGQLFIVILEKKALCHLKDREGMKPSWIFGLGTELEITWSTTPGSCDCGVSTLGPLVCWDYHPFCDTHSAWFSGLEDCLAEKLGLIHDMSSRMFCGTHTEKKQELDKATHSLKNNKSRIKLKTYQVQVPNSSALQEEKGTQIFNPHPEACHRPPNQPWLSIGASGPDPTEKKLKGGG